MKPKIVITQRVHSEVVDFLSTEGEVVLNTSENTLTREELMARSQDASAIMVFMPDTIDDIFIKACSNLKIVAAALKGYDNFDVEACTRHGIWFTIVPNLLAVPTAEMAIALLLGVSRHILSGDRFVRSGRFQGWRPAFYGTGLSGRTVGIIGMGAVGQAIAKRLSGFDCKVIYFDPQPLPEKKEKYYRVMSSSFEEILRCSDFLIPVVPLTEETKHLINRENIKTMKRGSYLINIGRGSVVDEGAVIEALDSGHLEGYAADVFEMEDWVRSDRPVAIPGELLGAVLNTLFTPHLGSAVGDIRKGIEMEAAMNILQALRGEQPSGAMNGPFR